MTLKILAFGIAREILGDASVVTDMGEGIQVGALKTMLQQQYPRLAGLASFMIAVNGEYASPETVIKAGDEIAIIPPVSGG
jgi:molybdopterin converting factor subunit 1